MKARIPSIYKTSRRQAKMAIDVANTEIRHAAYRMYLISCLALRDMGFGEKRMNEFIFHLNEYLNEYGERRSGDIADSKLFQEVEKACCIPVDEKTKAEMLEYEKQRFWKK